MSTDSDVVKAKYAEIAALRKAIADKDSGKKFGIQSGSGSRFQHQPEESNTGISPMVTTSGYYPPKRNSYPVRGRGGAIRSRGSGYPSTPYNRFSRGAMSTQTTHKNLVFDAGAEGVAPENEELESQDDSSTGNTETDSPKYVTHNSKGSMKLVSSETYKREHEKFLQLQRLRELQQQKLKIIRRQFALKQRISKNRTKTDSFDRVEIDGDKFAVTRDGTRLVPITLPVGQKPVTVTWNNQVYERKKNGVLKYRSRGRKIEIDQCRYFSRTGLCQKGSQCKYRHDQSQIRMCKQFLKGGCSNLRNCLYNHEPNEFNMPLCRFYLENKCSNAQCRFLHHKPKNYDDLNYEIWVCRPFAVGGSCSRGRKCLFLHTLNCPDFEEDGVCPKGNSCTLAHPITRRTQELMVTPSTTYVRPSNEEEDELADVEVESDTESTKPAKPKRIVVNSYTVDPSLLFASSVSNGKYDIYIDAPGEQQENQQDLDPNTYRENSEFLITNGDSSDESDSDDENGTHLDELEKNNDYVDF